LQRFNFAEFIFTFKRKPANKVSNCPQNLGPKNLICREPMPKLKLTAKSIAGLKAPDPSGKQVLYFDSELKGFGVLVSGKTNAKTFVAQRDLPGGKTRRISLGPSNILSAGSPCGGR
jgi:hypothetical protein